MDEPESNAHIVVVGAGCIGLTTAIELLKRSYSVLLVADRFPQDDLVADYASTAAGAHHLSFADDRDWRQRYFDQRTFDRLWEESRHADEGARIGLMRLTQTELYRGDLHLRFMEGLPDFRILDPCQRPSDVDHAVSFTSLTIEPARYLPYLVKTFTNLGGTFRRIEPLRKLADAKQHATSAKIIVNCTGLGARHLEDVRDLTTRPVRGQVVLLDAPWVKTGHTRQIGSLSGGEGGERTYVIPRASGEVIVGGTRDVDDWERQPRPETTNDILRRALEICPDLAMPPSARGPVDLRTLVKAEVVGFRPTRDEGIRLEPETLSGPDPLSIVHNYGHGGYGWQSMWGCAEEAAKIIGEELRKRELAELPSSFKAKL
ncbi:putative D-aspartate oxidase [Rhodotorula taiwanensis]|uniref:Putative D-aspartate oxidase n=1 Tax=Rhodotorula taiwanensis TaxID=741276 RepID=A0A2S5BGC3_9BASI|nr:putative D-aspartate oxidase [Rhodotorula taiwanensis]